MPTKARLAFRLQLLMRGLLSDLPLVSVLDLIHAARQTGVLDVQAEVPYTIAFERGEIIAGGILDWLSTEAIHTCPIMPNDGEFSFEVKPVTGTALGHYTHFVTEWARLSDEWQQICQIIDSPSRVFRGDVPMFDNRVGRSVRAAARKSDQPLFHVASALAEGVEDGRVEALERYAWYGLLLPRGAPYASSHSVSHHMDGRRNLGEIVDSGISTELVRDYLLMAIKQGLSFPGSGWVLRDLVWESAYSGL